MTSLARGRAASIILLLLATVGLVVHALQYSFVSDDAYISFRYAHNFAYHNELSFNLGERVEGYTNFLWTLLLGLLLKVRLRLDVMAHVLGAAFGVAVLVLTYLLTRLYRGGRPTGWDSLASLILAGSAGFAVWCTGGLETQMFTALALAGMTLYLAELGGHRRWRLSGVAFALAAMTRPEGLMLFGLTGLHLVGTVLIRERRLPIRRGELAWLGGFLVPFGGYFLWRYCYYGYPFPNTYYVKAGGGAAASFSKWGLLYLWDFVRENHLYVLAPLLLFFRPRTTASIPAEQRDPGQPVGLRPALFWSYVALIALSYIGYVTKVGGDFMAMGRFFVPIVPLLALFAQEGLRELVERPRRTPESWRPVRLVATAAVLAALLGYNSLKLYRVNQQLSYYRWGLDTIGYLKRFADDRILVGNWMRRNLPPQTYVAVGGAGAIVYASQMRSLDTFGLNDGWIAHHTPRVGDRPGHTKSAPEDYILRQRPDLLCHQAKHQDGPYSPPAGDPYWRARGYGWVCMAPEGLHPSHYCCLKRLDRALGPFPAELGS